MKLQDKERDEKKDYKEFKKGLMSVWIMFILFFVPILCLTREYKAAIIMASTISIMFGSILIAVIIGNKVNLFSKKNIAKKARKYEREIPKEYTVSMASLLIDNVFENNIDIPAIILSLIGKNILTYESNKLRVEHKEDLSNLYNHEIYIYECIKENKKIQSNKFKDYVIEDALKAKYIKKYDVKDFFEKSIIVFIGVIILLFICSISLMRLPEFLYYSIIIILFISAITSPIAIFNKYELDMDNPYKNTSLGNKEVRKLMGLKKYLKDFSMIDKKEIKEVVIWEDYLAYAYMFRINKKVFEEFKTLKQINNIVN